MCFTVFAAKIKFNEYFVGSHKKEDKSLCRDMKQVKANIMKALENGLALR